MQGYMFICLDLVGKSWIYVKILFAFYCFGTRFAKAYVRLV